MVTKEKISNWTCKSPLDVEIVLRAVGYRRSQQHTDLDHFLRHSTIDQQTKEDRS